MDCSFGFDAAKSGARRTGFNLAEIGQRKKVGRNSSGARTFHQFSSAIVVSKNLGLDYNQVPDGMKGKSPGHTLKSLGIKPDTAKIEISKAHQEIKLANKAAKGS